MKPWLSCVVLCAAILPARATSPDGKNVAPPDSGSLHAGKRLENVVVYGSANNFGPASSQMSAVTLGKSQILNVPIFLGEPDVLKSLQKFPGVQSGTDGTAGLFVRGGDYDQNYITLDGSAIYNAEHLRGYVSAINPDMVSAVNFYRGAFPARYGSRLSSVIDVGIKDGDFNRYHGLLSLGMLTGRLQAEGPIWKGHTSFNVAARLSYFNLIAKPLLEHFYDQKSALRPYSNMKYYDVTAKLVHKFNERSRLSALVYYGDDIDNEAPTASERHTDTRGDITETVDRQYAEDNMRSSSHECNWNNLLASLYFTTFVNTSHRLNINLNYSRYIYDLSVKNSIYNEINDLYRLYYYHDEKTVLTTHSGVEDMALTADGSWQLGVKHWLRYGVQLSHKKLNPYTRVFKDYTEERFRYGLNCSNDETLPVGPKYNTTQEYLNYKSGDNLNVDNLAAYVEDDFSVFSGLKLNYGLRFSSYFVTGKTYLALEPRLSLKQSVTSDLSLKLSYSNMTQGIHRLVTNNLVMPSDVWVAVTKNMPLMKSHLWGLGLSYDVAGFNISAETYYKTLSNVLEYRNGASYFLEGKSWEEVVAIGNGKSFGFEVLVERRVGNTTGWLTYTWSKALRKFDQPGNEINGGEQFYAATDRRHNFSATVTHHFRLSKKVSLDLGASWSYQSGRRGTVPIYVAWGQTVKEFVGDYTVIIYGEKLFGITNWIGIKYDAEHTLWSLPDGVAHPYQTYRKVNDFKLPDAHHLDVNANLSIKHRLGETIVGLCVYNVYNRGNISSVYLGYSGGKAVLKGICPFPIMPSLSVTQKF